MSSVNFNEVVDASESSAVRVRAALFNVWTICGSMRFFDEMLAMAESQSRLGNIILMPFCVFNTSEQLGNPTKTMLDVMHFAKIDLSVGIIVVCPTGYRGDSTRREIAYAYKTGKYVRYSDMMELRLEDV